ncbi:MAG TPA: serine hydrolase domain-containing protein [Lacibacter sp.]|nr:serine hydrolase domain-containing protein [Lacibacter sp.]
MKKSFLGVVLLFSAGYYLKAQQTTVTTLSGDDIKVITELLQKTGFNGSVFISQKGKTILDYHTGFADKEKGITNNNALRYNIGSIGKALTAVLILKLVEQSMLELEKTVAHYLPGTSLKNADKITIRQLLNMTSGLGDYFTAPGFDESTTFTNKAILEFVVQSIPLTDTPGNHVSYSNSAFIVAGAILEQMYQQEFREIVRHQLLLPAGITLSATTCAVGYELIKGEWKPAKNGNNPHAFAGAGGLFLSSIELHQLMQYIIKENYISETTLKRMWNKESHPEMDPPFVHYGLGWMVEEPGGVQLVGHNGGVEGFQAAFRYLPQDDLYISVLSNHGNGAEVAFMKVLMLWLHKKGVQF